MNERSRILQEAESLINGDRARDYGSAHENFARIARIWSVILGIDVTAQEVALCMAGLKLARLANGPHRDSYVDGAGYMALAGELALVDDPAVPPG